MQIPLNEIIHSRIEHASKTIRSLMEQQSFIEAACDAVTKAASAGRTIYTCGNGGSAAEAIHLAEELIGRYRSNRRPLRAICLNADVAAITCIANDFGFENVFARQVEALVTPDDVLVAFSTSGNSENIIRAINVACAQNAIVIGLLGNNGGTCAPLCTHSIVVQSDDSAHVQEAHQVVLHIFCEAIEEAFK